MKAKAKPLKKKNGSPKVKIPKETSAEYYYEEDNKLVFEIHIHKYADSLSNIMFRLGNLINDLVCEIDGHKVDIDHNGPIIRVLDYTEDNQLVINRLDTVIIRLLVPKDSNIINAIKHLQIHATLYWYQNEHRFKL